MVSDRDDLKVIPLYESGIPQIPDVLIDRKPKAYKPRAISLGPVHFGDSDFEDYEKRKNSSSTTDFPIQTAISMSWLTA